MSSREKMTKKLGLVMHYYQPPTQDHEIILKIINETYFPSANHLPNGVTVNIAGILLELFEK